AAVVTGMGRYLSPEDPGTSMTVEPELSENLGGGRALELATGLNLPFDPHQGVTVPKSRVSLTQDLAPGVSASLSAVALDFDRWSTDGHRVRGIATGKLT